MLKLPSLRAFHLHPAPGHQHPGQLPLPAFAKIKVSRAGLAAPHPAAPCSPALSLNVHSLTPSSSPTAALLPQVSLPGQPAQGSALPFPSETTAPHLLVLMPFRAQLATLSRPLPLTPHQGPCTSGSAELPTVGVIPSLTPFFGFLSVVSMWPHPLVPWRKPLPSPHTEVPACQGSAHLSRDPIPPGCARRVSLRLAGCC